MYFPPTYPKYLALCYMGKLAMFIFKAQKQEMGLLLTE